jgi:CarboxypepD_reg-like domain
MNRNQENRKQYSAADIQQYLEGKLSPEEMHALESAAQDDPFLADAIEGIQQMDAVAAGGDFKKDIQALEERLAQRIARKSKVLPITTMASWWRIAAVLVIFGAGLSIYSYLKKKDKVAPIAQLTSRIPGADSQFTKPAIHAQNSKGDSFRSSAPTSAAIPKNPGKKKTLSLENSNALQKINEEKRPAAIAAMDAAASNHRVAQDDKINNSQTVNQAEGKRVATKESVRPESDLNKSLTEGTLPSGQGHAFTGVVVNEYKQPLPGVSIAVRDQHAKTTTDKAGKFRLEVQAPDSIVNAMVQSTGYEPALIALKNENDGSHNIILLHENRSNLEIVTLSNSRGKKGNIGQPDSSFVVLQDAEPVTGWRGFYQYVEKNTRIPFDSLVFHGDVIVSFLLNQRGKMADFNIEQSLSPETDQEAMRLIKNGPDWKLLRNKQTRVFVKFSF